MPREEGRWNIFSDFSEPFDLGVDSLIRVLSFFELHHLEPFHKCCPKLQGLQPLASGS